MIADTNLMQRLWQSAIDRVACSAEKAPYGEKAHARGGHAAPPPRNSARLTKTGRPHRAPCTTSPRWRLTAHRLRAAVRDGLRTGDPSRGPGAAPFLGYRGERADDATSQAAEDCTREESGDTAFKSRSPRR